MTDHGKSANDAWLDDMDEMAGQYEQESAERTDREEVPDGNYQVHVDKVELVKAKTSGNTMLKWHLRIIAPACVGRKLFKNHVFTQACLRFIKQDLGLCGFDHANFKDLPNHLEELLDLQIEVAKRTKERGGNDDGRADGYSIYFNRLIGRGSAGSAGYDASAHDRLSSF